MLSAHCSLFTAHCRGPAGQRFVRNEYSINHFSEKRRRNLRNVFGHLCNCAPANVGDSNLWHAPAFTLRTNGPSLGCGGNVAESIPQSHKLIVAQQRQQRQRRITTDRRQQFTTIKAWQAHRHRSESSRNLQQYNLYLYLLLKCRCVSIVTRISLYKRFIDKYLQIINFYCFKYCCSSSNNSLFFYFIGDDDVRRRKRDTRTLHTHT